MANETVFKRGTQKTITTTGAATATLYEQNVTGSVTDYTDLRLRFAAS